MNEDNITSLIGFDVEKMAQEIVEKDLQKTKLIGKVSNTKEIPRLIITERKFR